MDFTAPYSMNVYKNYWLNGIKFTSIIYGNRDTTINGNSFGGHIVKRDLIPSDFLDSYSSTSLYLGTLFLKKTTWQYTSASMQSRLGFVDDNNKFFMRDMPSQSRYGISWNQMITEYCGSTTYPSYSGPWCNGNSPVDGNQMILFVK